MTAPTIHITTKVSRGTVVDDRHLLNASREQYLLEAFRRKLEVGVEYAWPYRPMQDFLSDLRRDRCWLRFEGEVGTSGHRVALATPVLRNGNYSARLFRVAKGGPSNSLAVPSTPRPIAVGAALNILRIPKREKETDRDRVRVRPDPEKRKKQRARRNALGGAARSIFFRAGLEHYSKEDAVPRALVAAGDYYLAPGIPAGELTFTFASASLVALSARIEGYNWKGKGVHPHALLIGRATAASEHELWIGGERYEVAGGVSIPGRNPSGPYLVLAVFSRDPGSGRWCITSAYAHPLGAGEVLVDSDIERWVLDELAQAIRKHRLLGLIISKPLYSESGRVFFDFRLRFRGCRYRLWIEVLGTDGPTYIGGKEKHKADIRSAGEDAILFRGYLRGRRQRREEIRRLLREIDQWVHQANKGVRRNTEDRP